MKSQMNLKLLVGFQLLIYGSFSQAQAPQIMDYQGVLCDNGGNTPSNQNISLRIGGIKNNTHKPMGYIKTHTTINNHSGYSHLAIGKPVSSTTPGINWIGGSHYVKDKPVFHEYSFYRTQLIPVPYTLYVQASHPFPYADNGLNNANLSIYASNGVAAQEFQCFSDERIKTIQGVSNSVNDLNTLMKIEITDYTMTDTISEGKRHYKKVIAQQVKEVYPLAIAADDIIRTVPDIYQLSSVVNGWISLKTDLQVGDRVELILVDREEILEVLEVNETGFKVDLDESGVVFVYGKEVDDFHTVDYEAISMLNVSATQELAKQLDLLQQENEELKTQLLTETASSNARLDKLEARLGSGRHSLTK